MPPGTPRDVRIVEKAMEELNFRRITFLNGNRRSGMPQQSGEAIEQARTTVWNEPELVINRATVLLACICLIRLQVPQWDDDLIAYLLRGSFPEFNIRPNDIFDLFHATCRNRPGWVSDMRQRGDLRQLMMTDDLLEMLDTNVLAHLPQLPQENYRNRRDGIRYLQDLVDIGAEERDYRFETGQERQG